MAQKVTKLDIVVLGSPQHEGRMVGRAFEILGVEPRYADPSAEEIFTPRPDVVVLSQDWGFDLRRATAAARAEGIPTVYLMDGVLEWAYLWDNWAYVKPWAAMLQPLMAERLCVIGRHPARILTSLGLGERIHVVGLPRLDEVDRERRVIADRKKHILIATAKTYGVSTAHQLLVRSTIRDLKNWFDGHPEFVAVWRIEPGLARDLGIEAAFDGSIFDQLRSVDAAISFTSTILLESMLLGVPTAQIDYRPVPQYVQTAWEIRGAEQIEPVIRDLLYPAPERLAFQEFCLRDELELGDASARLAAVLREAASSPIRPGDPTETLGILDYKHVNSHLTSFSLSSLTRVQYELDATYQLMQQERRDRRQAEDREKHAKAELSRLLEEPSIWFVMHLFSSVVRRVFGGFFGGKKGGGGDRA